MVHSKSSAVTYTITSTQSSLYETQQSLSNLFDTTASYLSDEKISPPELIIIFAIIFFVITILLVSTWSAILLVIGNTEGGGPLGTLMNFILSLL